jgi:hypothetical protein
MKKSHQVHTLTVFLTPGVKPPVFVGQEVGWEMTKAEISVLVGN